VLLQSELVSQAVVLAKEESNGNKRLVGYVVAKNYFDKEAIITFLSERLPDYMVPAIWIELESIPLTGNGKVDKGALPEPDASKLATNQYVAPVTDLESMLTGIWQEILSVERVGVEDNFFELGGDSILAIQVVSRANRLGYTLQPKDIFIHHTIARLSVAIVDRNGGAITAEQGELTGFSGLLPIQQWYLEQESKEVSHFNQSVLVSIDKSVTVEVLTEALRQICSHHDALRFKYYKQDGQWKQEYGAATEVRVIFEDVPEVDSLSTSLIAERTSKYQQSLDIERGRLLQPVLIRTPSREESNYLLLIIHHLAVDGVSWRILLKDLELAITQLSSNQSINLGGKSASYRQWYNKLEQYSRGEQLLSQRSYWQQVIDSYEPIKLDHKYYNEVKTSNIGRIQVRLPTEQTLGLIQQVPKVYHTEINDILLAALGKTLCSWSETSKIVIGVEGHGREDIPGGTDTSGTVGWFTNIYPLLLQVDTTNDNDELIKTVKEQLRRVPDKGLGYGVLKYIVKEETLQIKKCWDVTFNYLGRLDNLAGESTWIKGSGEGAEASRNEDQIIEEKLSVNGRVISGELILDWGYSSKHFNEATVQKIASAYIDCLASLITHCIEQERLFGSVNTPSDYGLGAEVNYKELDKFLQETVAGKQRKEQIEGLYRLSGTQQGLLFHSLYNKEAGGYIEQIICDLIAPDGDAVVKSWQYVLGQHSILRSAFYHDIFSVPVQCVYKHVDLPVVVIDYRHMAGLEQDAAIDKYKAGDRASGFDFKAPPLVRLALFRLSDEKYQMLWTSHHILFDGWSLPILIEDFLTNYEILASGQKVTITKEDKFEDYIRFLERLDQHDEAAYWSHYLHDVEQATMLPFIPTTTDRNRGVGTFETRNLKIDKILTSKVQAYAKRNWLTVNSIMQGVWSYLLHEYCGSDTITYGVTVSGRPDNLPYVDGRVGMFINTVPLKSQLKKGQIIVEWLQAVQQDQVASRQYQYTPLHRIQDYTDLHEDLFDTTLTFQNYPINNLLISHDWALKIENLHVHEQNNYPLSLTISIAEEITIRVIYNASLLQEEYLHEIENHFRNVLLQIVENDQADVDEIKLLTGVEEQQLLFHFNNTARRVITEETVVTLIEEQAIQTPEAIALIFKEKQLTYKELSRRSNQLAHYLIGEGVKPETLIPICIEPGFEMIIGILGILKAGAAYVPIDPNYPAERIQYIIEDTSAKMVISSQASRSKLTDVAELNIIEIDADNAAINIHPDRNPAVAFALNHLAYIIYTSGSTGEPKGVMIEHRSLINYLLNSKARYINGEKSNSGTFLHLSYTFDASITGIFMPLLAGKSIVIGSKDSLEVFKDATLLKYAPYDFIKITPAHIRLLEATLDKDAIAGLTKKLVVGGEVLHPGHLDYLKDNNIDLEIVNEYGPTEATVGCSTYSFSSISNITRHDSVSIGKPIDNVEIYVAGRNNQPGTHRRSR
jgi:amino acid adenylation domain-containing protein/non-ribosomal peptide synthase protein (TIGR01720 family)